MNDIWEQELENLLNEDLSSVRRREQQGFDRLVSPFGNSIVLFGAGHLGRTIAKRLRQGGIEPLAFADNNARLWGSRIDGILVRSPQEAAERFGAVAAVIWSPGSHHRFSETSKELRALGCGKVVSFVPFYWKYADDFLPVGFLDLPHKIYSWSADIRAAFRLMADEESRQNFVTQLKWRTVENYDQLPPCTQEAQYFPEQLFRFSRHEVFVDCGAFDGDTIRDYLARPDHDFSRICAFEPDPMNFEKLSKYVGALPSETRTKIVLAQQAVGRQTERLAFATTGTASSLIRQDGGTEVMSVSIDDVLQQHQPTYIKMDIEGSEMDALVGARTCIENNLPVLAICVYHRPTHLWEIPLLIHSMSDRYRFFLKAHQEEGWDLVCYAVPVQRLKV